MLGEDGRSGVAGALLETRAVVRKLKAVQIDVASDVPAVHGARAAACAQNRTTGAVKHQEIVFSSCMYAAAHVELQEQ